jgi:predicted MPP superfamily phosphohydrolase
LNQNTVDSSTSAEASSVKPISRRRFLTTGLCGGAGLALYSGEIERHWIDVTSHDIHLRSLPPAFEGMKIVQLSDIHLDEFTEAFLLRQAVDKINQINPDVIFLTGDYVSYQITPKKYSVKSAWKCAEILDELKCKQRYAILGNHDAMLGEKVVTDALLANGMTVLNNAYLPLERAGSRVWLVGLDDPVCGQPDPDAAIPASIRNVANEPVIVLCHAPDYADDLLAHPAGKFIDLMLSGHTHGGQVRVPFVPAMGLPPGGRKYVDGWFKLGSMQLYVNRGIGTVGVPFRFACPPEITTFTLRAPQAIQAA